MRINRDLIKKNTSVLFVFGDNDLRRGLGGQAKEFRGEPNSIGICTKKAPNTSPEVYYRDEEYTQNIEKIDKDIAAITEKMGAFSHIYIPEGIGTGLAKLQENAPKTLSYLKEELKGLEKVFDCYVPYKGVVQQKLFYFDVETSGLKPDKNAILQLGIIIEIDGEVKEEIQCNVQPREGDVVDDKALEINGLKKEDFPSFVPPDKVLRATQRLLGKYINKFDKDDKFICCGYNVGFDVRFLRSFFYKGNDKFFGSYFHKEVIDPMPEMNELYNTGAIDTENYKLTSVCEYYGIKLEDAHSALADIRATRELIKLRNTQPE